MNLNRYRRNRLFFTPTLAIVGAILACSLPGGQPAPTIEVILEPTLRPTQPESVAPTPVPSDLVWFAPNMGSVDYTQLFTESDPWSLARERIDVFKFYTQNVLDDPCPICGDNILRAFVDVDAFRKLTQWGVAVGLEVGAVKPWGCTSDVTFDAAQRAIRNVEAHGGEVAFLAMDEPRVGGEENTDGISCRYTTEQSVAETAAFIKRVRAAYPDMVVGDIEAYPHFSASEIEAWTDRLAELGAKPSFLHMDIDIERVRVEGADVANDLRQLSRFGRDRGISFGVIFTSNWREAGSNRAYVDSTMGWIRTVEEAIGKPDHLIFQSWQGPAPSGDHEVPVNLPQNDPAGDSHVGLVNQGLEVFDAGRVGPAPQPPSAAGEVVLHQPFGIVVAYMGPQTGTGSALFTPLQQAGQKAIEDHGPVHGFGVNLIDFNDFCTEAGGEAAAEQIVADERIVAVIGLACSRSAVGALPILEANNVVMISGGATQPGLSVYGPTVFHRSLLDDDQAHALGYPSQIYIEDLPSVQAWLAEFAAWGGGLLETGLNHYSPYQYDAMGVLLRALDLSSQALNDGSLVIDREALQAAVRGTTDYPGVTGYITFEADGDRSP